MAEYDNTNRITLFHNDKQGNEARPDLNGVVNVEGTEWSVSIWRRESKSGQEFFSGQIQPRKERQAPRNNAKAVAAPAGDDFDSEIPF